MTWSPTEARTYMQDMLRSAFGSVVEHLDVTNTYVDHNVRKEVFLGESSPVYNAGSHKTMRIEGRLRNSAFRGGGQRLISEIEELFRQHSVTLHIDGRFEMTAHVPADIRSPTPLTDEALPEISEQVRSGTLTGDEGVAATQALTRMEVLEADNALDLIARDRWNIVRNPGETDVELRKRIAVTFCTTQIKLPLDANVAGK